MPAFQEVPSHDYQAISSKPDHGKIKEAVSKSASVCGIRHAAAPVRRHVAANCRRYKVYPCRDVVLRQPLCGRWSVSARLGVTWSVANRLGVAGGGIIAKLVKARDYFWISANIPVELNSTSTVPSALSKVSASKGLVVTTPVFGSITITR